MSEDNNGGKGGEYDVGYGKPPKHSQFVPGQSGFKGKRKKSTESHKDIIARVRDEVVIVNGKPVSKFELAITQTFNQTIKSGKPRDLKQMLELLDKYGAVPEVDRYAEMKADSEKVLLKIGDIVDRMYNLDPTDRPLLDAREDAEVKIVMGCPQCAPALRKQWADPEYKALAKRYEQTRMHSLVKSSRARTS